MSGATLLNVVVVRRFQKFWTTDRLAFLIKLITVENIKDFSVFHENNHDAQILNVAIKNKQNFN